MSLTPDEGPPQSEQTVTGWARLPRWQHVTLIVLCVIGLVAAIANVVVAESNKDRAFHVAFALLDAGVLVSLVVVYRRRRGS